MTRMRSLKAALFASVWLLPLAAAAQSDDEFDVGDKPAAASQGPASTNYFMLGGQYSSGRSYYLNRFSGAVDPGFAGLGGLHYSWRDPWDSGGTRYYEVDGDNLGFWDRSFSMKMGDQGTWGVTFSYDGIPYYATNSFQSVLQSNGKLIQGVAPGSLSVTFSQLLPKVGILNSLWIPTATNPPKLSYSSVSTQRDIFAGTAKYQYGDWTITSGWRHEHKEGTQINSLAIGGAPSVTSAGSGAAAPTSFTSGLVYFAQPIDYDTDRYEISAAQTTRPIQMQVGYTFSQFTDNALQFNAQNPFNFYSSTLATIFGGPASGVTAIYALPPSNSAHQVKGQFGFDLTDTSRLNVNLGAGLQLQNSGYQSGIGNNANLAQNLPRASFDGMMRTFYGNITYTAHPIANLDIRAALTLDDRDNASPRNAYLLYPVSTLNTNFVYSNLPFSYQKQAGTFEAGYRLGPQTKITLTETADSTRRTFADTTLVNTNRVDLKLRGPLMDNLFGTAGVAHEDRWANAYNSAAWWQAACNSCNVEPRNFLMFYEASRKHNEARGTLDYSPLPNVTASMQAKLSKDTYPSGNMGLRNNTNLSVGPDVSWQINKSLTAHGYYTYQRLYYDQSSIYQSPGAPSIPAPTPTNTAYSVPYNASTNDSVHSFGANLDWQAIPDQLKVSLDYTFSYGNTAYALGEGVVAYGGAITSPTFAPAIGMQALPNVTSMLSVVSLKAEYKVNSNITLVAGYAWERFTYKDFMVGTSATQYANALLPGSLAPNDSVHVVSASLRIRF